MNDIFSTILGQPKVRDFLRKSSQGARISQSYLFLGPCGSNKTQAAYCLACAYLCDDSDRTFFCDCKRCQTCSLVMKKKHPDVKYFAPAGQGGYLVEQMRDIIHDSTLAPVEARRKVYIIDRVDVLGTSAANAFLKTLEEPQEGVMFILLGRTVDAVLPTIRSRAEIVPFRHIPPSEAQKIIVQNTGLDEQKARIALICSGNSISRAIELLRSSDRGVLLLREQIVGEVLGLVGKNDWEAIKCAKRIVELLGVEADAYKKEVEEKIAENDDFLSAAAKKEIKTQESRTQKSKNLETLRTFANVVISILRDSGKILRGGNEIVNSDFFECVQTITQSSDLDSLYKAIASIVSVIKTMNYNVSHETCIDVILFEFKGAYAIN